MMNAGIQTKSHEISEQEQWTRGGGQLGKFFFEQSSSPGSPLAEATQLGKEWERSHWTHCFSSEAYTLPQHQSQTNANDIEPHQAVNIQNPDQNRLRSQVIHLFNELEIQGRQTCFVRQPSMSRGHFPTRSVISVISNTVIFPHGHQPCGWWQPKACNLTCLSTSNNPYNSE